MSTSTNLSTVKFHGDTIFVVDHENEPYVPMRPIIESMGLNWKAQYAKLNHNRARWGCVVITTTQPTEVQTRKFVSMPLRKLPGFLATINPTKVRNELRAKIVLYQNECDDALWNHWRDKAGSSLPALAKVGDRSPGDVEPFLVEMLSRLPAPGYSFLYSTLPLIITGVPFTWSLKISEEYVLAEGVVPVEQVSGSFPDRRGRAART